MITRPNDNARHSIADFRSFGNTQKATCAVNAGGFPQFFICLKRNRPHKRQGVAQVDKVLSEVFRPLLPADVMGPLQGLQWRGRGGELVGRNDRGASSRWD